MQFANSILDVLLQLIGLFYAFAGYVGVRAVHRARLLDVAIDQLSEDKTPPREHQRMLWLLIGALITLAGGLALLLQADLAAWIFALSAAGQFLYLLAAAPYYFDRAEKPDDVGRQGSINATILYAVATTFVLWALQTARLKPVASIPFELVASAVIGVCGYAIWSVCKFAKPFGFACADRSGEAGGDVDKD